MIDTIIIYKCFIVWYQLLLITVDLLLTLIVRWYKFNDLSSKNHRFHLFFIKINEKRPFTIPLLGVL